MNTDRTVTPRIDGGPSTAAFEGNGSLRQPRRPRLGAAGRTAHASDRQPRRREPADGAERAASAGPFNSVICVMDRSANGRAARDQAALLAPPGGAVEIVDLARSTGRGHDALRDVCDGHDLLVLGAGAAASAVVQRAPISTLVARWSPLGSQVTDTILVPVDGSPRSTRAVQYAGRLAAVHGGTVCILGAPPPDRALQRAIAASGCLLHQLTGSAPRLLGQQLPPEQAIPSAAVALAASLVVLGSDSSENARRMAAEVAGCVGCSVLALPDSGPDPELPRAVAR